MIDYQSQPDGIYRFMMNYQDHAVKFLNLRCLVTKRAAEVAYLLLEIFLVFGAPLILQSDNGREFVAEVIRELKDLWPECTIVHGRARHPQSQGSVERSNQDVERMVTLWCKDNNSTKWSIGMKFVQFQKNKSYHSGLGCSPYEALFGHPAKVGLANTLIPTELL